VAGVVGVLVEDDKAGFAAMDDEIVDRIFRAKSLAKDTPFFPFTLYE